MVTDKIIWVTGGTSGLGKAIVQRLAQQTNQIFVTARNSENLEQLAALAPHRITPIVGDVSDSASLKRAVDQIKMQADHLDLVILCAGTCEYQDGATFNMDMYRRVLDTNFMGSVDCIQQAMPLLNGSVERGHIVAISSLSSLVPFTRAEAYGASKAALDYFIASARVDFPQLDFTLIRPGFIDTPLVKNNDFPMPGLMSAEQAAEKVLSAIVARKRVYNFPFLLSTVLLAFSKIPGIWGNLVAPRLVKKDVL
jgi:NAD(P)-dependent dehydrogenase (short-subunit alcohol dehydrogenase family)